MNDWTDKQLLTMVFAAASIIKRMQVAWSDQECTGTHGWCCQCERVKDNPPCPGHGAKTWLQIAEQLKSATLADNNTENESDELAAEMAGVLDDVEFRLQDLPNPSMADIHLRGRVTDVLAKYRGEAGPTTRSEPYWWCPACECEVDAGRVTYEEVHDVCGCPVEWRGEVKGE